MSLDNPWTKHRQSFWEEHSGNPRLTLWLRTAALAYGKHRRSGHAPFKAGELALSLTTVDQTTGLVHTPGPAEISRAIRTCVEYGFLSPLSCSRCLVVPTFAVTGGVMGSPKEKCHQHRGRWSA